MTEEFQTKENKDYISLFKATEVSLRDLEESNPKAPELYLTLGVFPSGKCPVCHMIVMNIIFI